MSLPIPSQSGIGQSHGALQPATGGVLRLVPERAPSKPDHAGPPGLRQRVTPGAVLAALRRRWSVALALGLVLALGAAATAWTLRPEKYTAFAIIQVASAEPKMLPDATRLPDGATYTRTQIALVRSRPVLLVALRNEKVRQLPFVQAQPEPVEWLEKELVVEQIPNTEIVRVSLTARGGKSDLAPVVNAVVEAYMAEVVGTEQASQKAHLYDLDKAARSVKEQLRQLRESVQSITRALKGGDPKILTLKQQALLDESASLKRELAVTNSRHRDLEIKIALYRLRLDPVKRLPIPWYTPAAPGGGGDALIEHELDTDPRVVTLEAEAAKLRDQLKRLEAIFADPNNVAKKDAQRRLSAAEAAVATAREERRVAIAARDRARTVASTAQLLREAEIERDAIQSQREALSSEVNALKGDIESLGLSSVSLELERAEVERSEQFHRTILEQKQRLELELQNSARQRVSVRYRAEDAAVLNKNGRFQEAAGAGLMGLFAGLFAVAAFDLRGNRIHTPADVSRGLRLRVIGSLPNAPDDRPAGGGQSKYRRGFVESIDGLRTTLLHAHSEGRGAALMVSSSGPGEGKTTLATELAASLARARRRTVLVDFDLRVPSLHRLFGVVHAPGVCEVLAGTAGLDQVIRPTETAHLHILAAGKLTHDATAALAQRATIQRVVDELRARYDFVIIDSSPLLLVPDALMVAGCVDGLLYSVRPGISRAADVYAGYERLNDHQLPFLGVVVNGVAHGQSYAQGYGQPLDSPAPTVVAGDGHVI